MEDTITSRPGTWVTWLYTKHRQLKKIKAPKEEAEEEEEEEEEKAFSCDWQDGGKANWIRAGATLEDVDSSSSSFGLISSFTATFRIEVYWNVDLIYD